MAFKNQLPLFACPLYAHPTPTLMELWVDPSWDLQPWSGDPWKDVGAILNAYYTDTDPQVNVVDWNEGGILRPTCTHSTQILKPTWLYDLHTMWESSHNITPFGRRISNWHSCQTYFEQLVYACLLQCTTPSLPSPCCPLPQSITFL